MVRALISPLVAWALIALPAVAQAETEVRLVPANGAHQVNPDTQLSVTFASPPVPGTAGPSAFTTMADHTLVDSST